MNLLLSQIEITFQVQQDAFADALREKGEQETQNWIDGYKGLEEAAQEKPHLKEMVNETIDLLASISEYANSNFVIEEKTINLMRIMFDGDLILDQGSMNETMKHAVITV